MSEAVENSEVLTGDISTATERDSVDQQETTGTGSADGIRRIVANKAGFNQLSSKITRFEAVAKDPQNVFELPEELLNYANKYIGVFCLISILTNNPVPSNIDKPPKIDDFFKELLGKKRKS